MMFSAASRLPHRAPDFDPRASNAGFTLIELLVTLAILGVLVAIATPQVMKYLGRAKVETAKIEINNISMGLDLFLIDNGRYPTEQEGLKALVEPPQGLAGWAGPYIKKTAAPVDPWGRPYVYRVGRNGEYELSTADDQPGAEKIAGTRRDGG